jgi:glyoxylase-like metal-dependent hydrolase (beta-lactamase superfamily II)
MAGSRLKVGSAEITWLLDTPMSFPWSAFFPAVPQSEFEPYRSEYPASYGDGVFNTQASVYLVRSAGKTILCDTGVGPGPHDWLGGARGALGDELRSSGVAPADVDAVFFTHLHPDHVGWNLAGGKPAFPNARHLVSQADFDAFAGAPHMGLVTPLKDAGVLELFSGERTLTDEVTAVPTPGHTPGHTSLLVSSRGEKLLITGDLAHHPAQLDRIEWCSSFDGDPGTAVETRRKMVDKLEAEGLTAALCHFPGIPFGTLVRLEGKRILRGL